MQVKKVMARKNYAEDTGNKMYRHEIDGTTQNKMV
jgi:hypothetical protein